MNVKKENFIDINLFSNWYIGSNSYEFFIYKFIKKKDKDEMVDYKDKFGHYSTIESLFDNLPDKFLKSESNAKTFGELKEDLNKIHKIIEEVKDQLR